MNVVVIAYLRKMWVQRYCMHPHGAIKSLTVNVYEYGKHTWTEIGSEILRSRCKKRLVRVQSQK